MKYLVIILLTLTSSISLFAQAEITQDELRQHIEYLASDKLEGRKPGTAGCRLASDYIQKDFNNAGLALAADDGFQSFKLVTGAETGPNSKMMVGNYVAVLDSQFIPYSFSANATLEEEVVFCGYGIEVSNDTLKYNDYSDVNVKGRWVLLLRADPMPDNVNSPFTAYAEERSKVIRAIDAGAKGVLFVSGFNIDKEDNLGKVFYDKSPTAASIPVFQISRTLADRILGPSGHSVAMLEVKITRDLMPFGFYTGVRVIATADVRLTEAITHNVIAYVSGTDPQLRSQYIVVGAHYDHLGHGGPGSGSRIPDTLAIHNGADDNASGVAAVLELAEYFKAHPTHRTLVFVAFSAEESGLIGSKEYTAEPVFPLESTIAMVNLDMVGRLNLQEPSLMISGTGTSKQSEDILNALTKNRPFTANYSPEGFGASDHSSFYVKDIPVFFLTTGAHDDYHKPSDDADRINYEGEKIVTEFTRDLLEALGNRDSVLAFQEAGPKFSSSRGRGYSVTMGILPDFTSQSNNGLRVDGVRPGGPAEKGGMAKGDVIMAIEGHDVTNIYDYMFRMKKFEKGQTVSVDVLRDGKHKVLIVQL